MRNKRSGFTLLELIIVVIVIGILASVALPRYVTIAEKGRAAEGKSLLATIKAAQIRYAAQYGTFTNNESLLDTDFQTPKYFNFTMASVTALTAIDSGTVIVGVMTRNTYQRGGNVPAYVFNISQDGTLGGVNATAYL